MYWRKMDGMGRRPLLAKEKVLVALQRWTAGHGRSPSLEELRREMGVGSTRTVFRYLEMLEEDGAIERRPGASGVKLLKPNLVGTQTRAVAIVGHVAAGSPMLAEENVESWVRLPKDWASPSSDKFFLLHIRGTSMNKARVEGGTIDDGDLVLVHQQPTAKTGDVIVGLVDGEATVKRLVTTPGYCLLKPDSKDKKHRPILVDSDFLVLGKVARVLKRGSAVMRTAFEDVDGD
jgi:repressor LexA